MLALKGNQGNLHEQTRCYLDEAYELALDLGHYHEEKARGHGRREIRRCWAMDELGDWLKGVENWKDLRSVAVVEREWTEKGVTRVERRYSITSLGPDAEVIGRAVRSHWGIENSVHWVLDVVFREDESRVRTGHAPENLAALRRLACAMVKRADPGSKASIQLRRFKAAVNPTYLGQLLGVSIDA